MTGIIFSGENCGRKQEFMCYLLFGSLAITVSDGRLGSPAPDRLIADTLNTYAAPSNTSFTAYFVSVEKGRNRYHVDRECSFTFGESYQALHLHWILPAASHKLHTWNRPSLVYKAPVIGAFLVFLQIVSHYFSSSSVTWRTPCQIDAVFKGTD